VYEKRTNKLPLTITELTKLHIKNTKQQALNILKTPQKKIYGSAPMVLLVCEPS